MEQLIFQKERQPSMVQDTPEVVLQEHIDKTKKTHKDENSNG